jgi:hypothetical protein
MLGKLNASKRKMNFEESYQILEECFILTEGSNYREFFKSKRELYEKKFEKKFGQWSQDQKKEFFNHIKETWSSEKAGSTSDSNEVAEDQTESGVVGKDTKMGGKAHQPINKQMKDSQKPNPIHENKDILVENFLAGLREKPTLLRVQKLEEQISNLLEENDLINKAKLRSFMNKKGINNFKELTIDKQESVMKEAINYLEEKKGDMKFFK